MKGLMEHQVTVQSSVLVSVLLIIASSIRSCYGYNVDLVSPLVVSSGLPDSVAANYSFGFSIAHHQFSNGDKALLVGAPKAYYNGLREGGVYTCPLRHGQTCDMSIVFNSRKNSDGDSFADDLPSDNRFLDDQMLGYSVTSSRNGIIMACAPMFIGTFEGSVDLRSYDTTGRCLYLPQDFNDTTVPFQITPGTFLFSAAPALAVAGIDAIIYQPDENDVLYTFGAVRSGPSSTKPGGVYSVEQNDIGAIVPAAVSEFPSTVANEKFQGYHLEQGRFFQTTMNDLLASGPKASSHKGQIIAYAKNNQVLERKFIITGPGSAIDGYFGFDFALVDLQTGGFDSLVVGCPLCEQDTGLVYVYVHLQDSITPVNVSGPQIVSPPSSQAGSGQFGMAVENVGDIDLDGYEDIAISAPYQGQGVVYIFRGGPAGFVTEKYQEIPAPVGTEGFGYIITAAGDIDGNGYPDFTIGDLSNKGVYTYRSSPIVDVEISTQEGNHSLDYSIRNCELQGIPSICFDITPCFKFSTVHGQVNEFAVKYTLIVDEQDQRVGLLDNILTNQVTKEITIVYSENERTCEESHKFVLVPSFSNLDPIPMSISITNADSLLPLPSADSALHGGDLHPILSLSSDGSSIQPQILPNYVQTCDGVCDPVFIITVTPDISTENDVILWAPEFTFSISIHLRNTNEDSLASFLLINVPQGIRMTTWTSVTLFAVSSCESSAPQEVRCLLRNPIIVNEEVEFRVFFRPDVYESPFTGQDLIFDFTAIQDSKPRGTASMTLSAESVASYNIEGSFGTKLEQATRFLPSINQSIMSLSAQGPAINYQVTVNHTGYADEESPVPSLLINIIWPAVLNVEGGDVLPLLVPTGIVIIGSDSTTCKEYGAIPSHLLSFHQQSPLVLPNITQDVSLTKNCPTNITCGVIQCEVLNLPPQRRETATPPIQISVFSTLWSNAVRNPLNVSIYVSAESTSVYPSIMGSITNSQVSIRLQPAVTETLRKCFQLWIVIVSVIGGLVLAFILIAFLGLCGCFGRGYYKKKEEDQRRELAKSQQHKSSATIQPPAAYTDSLKRSKDKEAEADDEAAHIPPVSMPESFAPYTAPPLDQSLDEPITDDMVMRTLVPLQPLNIEGTDTGPDLETEI